MPRTTNDPALERPVKGETPVRQCAVTRERLPQTQMVRFVADPDGRLVPDIAGKLPGRGVWAAADRKAVEDGVKKRAFSRGLKQDVSAPEDLADMVERLLLDRCTGLLGMAKKSGRIVLGFDQVRAALQKEEPGWMLEASDGAEDGRNKLHFLAKALYEEVQTAGALSSEELGMAFGRGSVVHGLLRNGPLEAHWAVAYGRLTGFRPAPEANWFSERRRV